MQRSFVALALAAACLGASAQTVSDSEWKEMDTPPPPALRTQGLIPVDVSGTSLRFGVDPASVTVRSDGVVRYVIVASSSSGAVNAMYEGIRCDKAVVKVYARHNPDSGWVPAQSDWQPLQRSAATRHSLAVATGGACFGDTPNGSAAQVVQDLRAPIDRRFERGGVNR